jgi:hypothetical protein
VKAARSSALAGLGPTASPFDLVFIDADKPSNPEYLAAALTLTRPGSVIVADNVVRDGAVADARRRGSPRARGSAGSPSWSRPSHGWWRRRCRRRREGMGRFCAGAGGRSGRIEIRDRFHARAIPCLIPGRAAGDSSPVPPDLAVFSERNGGFLRV